jgi:hypothetical protein
LCFFLRILSFVFFLNFNSLSLSLSLSLSIFFLFSFFLFFWLCSWLDFGRGSWVVSYPTPLLSVTASAPLAHLQQ